MDRQATHYLQRIGHSGDVSPTGATLRELQRAHLFAVFFENLDIGWGIPIRLDHDALYDKIVTRGRGGCCYELNGLFGWLLRELGYRVANLSASDVKGDGTFGPDFDHLVLRVTCPADADPDAVWLADVGWGDTFIDPLRLVPNLRQREGDRTYWLEPQGERLVLHMRDWDGYEEAQYAFTLREHPFEAFFAMNEWHQNSSDSAFGTNRVITQPTATGRKTLRVNRCILTEGTQRIVTDFSEEEFAALLMHYFGIAAPHSS